MQYSMLENGLDFIISGITHLKRSEREKHSEAGTRQGIKICITSFVVWNRVGFQKSIKY